MILSNNVQSSTPISLQLIHFFHLFVFLFHHQQFFPLLILIFLSLDYNQTFIFSINKNFQQHFKIIGFLLAKKKRNLHLSSVFSYISIDSLIYIPFLYASLFLLDIKFLLHSLFFINSLLIITSDYHHTIQNLFFSFCL